MWGIRLTDEDFGLSIVRAPLWEATKIGVCLDVTIADVALL
jgi:hypothetical protein